MGGNSKLKTQNSKLECVSGWPHAPARVGASSPPGSSSVGSGEAARTGWCCRAGGVHTRPRRGAGKARNQAFDLFALTFRTARVLGVGADPLEKGKPFAALVASVLIDWHLRSPRHARGCPRAEYPQTFEVSASSICCRPSRTVLCSRSSRNSSESQTFRQIVKTPSSMIR